MRFYLFANAEYPAGIELGPRVDDHVRQALLARDKGFVGLAMGQHLSIGDLQWFPPLPFASYLAAHCPGMRLALTVVLLPHVNPVALAEAVAFADVLTGGRLDVGVAPGWAAAEFTALGVDHSQRLAIFEQRVVVLDALLRGQTVEVPGPDGLPHAVTLGLQPVQRPRPPLWLGSSSPGSARSFGRYVDTLVMSAHVPLEQQVAIKAAFLAGRPAGAAEPADTPIIRNVFVAPTRAEALAQAMPYLERSYAAFDDWGLFSRVLREEHPTGGLPESVLGRVILGDPDDVVQGLRLTSERLRTRTFVLRMQWKGMPSKEVEDAITLFGDHVMPHL